MSEYRRHTGFSARDARKGLKSGTRERSKSAGHAVHWHLGQRSSRSVRTSGVQADDLVSQRLADSVSRQTGLWEQSLVLGTESGDLVLEIAYSSS